MKEKKTIVYGLGKIFNDNKHEIMVKYNVIGLCDKNKEKVIGNAGG